MEWQSKEKFKGGGDKFKDSKMVFFINDRDLFPLFCVNTDQRNNQWWGFDFASINNLYLTCHP